MEEFKNIFASRTVISAIIVLVAAIVNIFGYTIDPKTQAELIEMVMTIITAVGALAAIYFRVVATKKIK